MITLKDDDLVGLISISVELTKMQLFSLISRRVFERSHVEWYMSDFERILFEQVSSDTAKARLQQLVDATKRELLSEVELMKSGE